MTDDERLTRIEQQLDELLEISEEQTELMLQARRAARWGFWLKVVIWAFVLVVPFLVIGQLLKTFMPGEGFGALNSQQVQNAIDAYTTGFQGQ
jgi:cell division septal protein FtsQ